MNSTNMLRIVACCTFSLLGALPLASRADSMVARHSRHAVQKVVFQVSDNHPAKWNLTLNNARNFQTEFGRHGSAIEVVAYGPGINRRKFDSEVGSRVMDESREGIRFAACKNTMRARKLTPKDMLDHIHYVPSGVGELVMKQHRGYAYIKP